MSDDAIEHHDDAPPATWKKGDADNATPVPPQFGTSMTSAAVTINRPASELFSYFRDFKNLSMFVENIERIDVIDHNRSHWVVKAPAGRTVEWDSIVTNEALEEFIDWTSAPGADVANGGRVEFRDAGERGTVVTATIRYDPPAGIAGKIVAKMFQRERYSHPSAP